MSWLELYDEPGRLVGRRPADALPCTIGADASNALVSRAAGVAARHAEVSLASDGRILVRDLGSEVGLRRGSGGTRLDEADLAPGDELLIGDSRLRLVADAAVPLPTATQSASDQPWHDQLDVKVAAPLVLFVLAAAVGWWVSTDEEPVIEGLAVGAAVLTFEVIWAGAWALVNRLRFSRARFGQHFAVGVAATVAGVVLGDVAAWVDYLEPESAWAAAVGFLALVLIWAIALRLHLGVMIPGGPGPVARRIIAGAALALGGCMSWAPGIGRGDFTTETEYAVQLKPFPAALLPAQDTAAFAFGLRKLKEELLADLDSLAPRAGHSAVPDRAETRR